MDNASNEFDKTRISYRLHVGQEIRYRFEPDMPSGVSCAESALNSIEWIFLVLDESPLPNWRVAFQQTRVVSPKRTGGGVSQQRVSDDGFFEMDCYGHISRYLAPSPTSSASVMFPLLPRDSTDSNLRWEASSVDDMFREYAMIGKDVLDDRPILIFRERAINPLDELYSASRSRLYVFDVAMGLVVHATTFYEQAWPSPDDPLRESGTISLVGTTGLHSSSRGAVSRDAETYFLARAKYDLVINKALQDPHNTRHCLAEAEHILVALDRELTTPFIRGLLRDRLQLHQREEQYLIDDAEEISAQLNVRAGEWEKADINGNTHALDAYIGSVVVLAFWQRGCAWSMRSIPTVQNVARDCGDGVVFLGISLDGDVEDARFVANHFMVSFPVIWNRNEKPDIARHYGINGLPSVVIIDKCGRVYRILTGHSVITTRALSELLGRLQNYL